MKVYWRTLKEKWLKPPKNQFPTGTRVYKGFQGSGKTLSMVFYAFQVQKKYPKCIVYSNIKITGLNNFRYFNDDDGLKEALETRNGGDGVLVLLDEAHLYFGKKSGIPLDVLTAISQQRKDRRRIVFSSQIWEELDISLRKQVKEIVSCRTFLHKFQINTISDGESLTYDKLASQYVAKTIRTEIFKHFSALYSCYDTNQKIISNSNYSRSFSPNINVSFQPEKQKK